MTVVELPVKAIVAGDFTLPPDCHLVSGIYKISCPQIFNEKVTLHLHHAALIHSEEEASHFRFYAAKCSIGPPYQFRELKDGTFTPFSESASIKLHQFSYFATGARRQRRLRYYSQVIYKPKQFHEWDMFFLIVKDDPAFIKVIQNGIYSFNSVIVFFVNSSLKCSILIVHLMLNR